jgi:hypothetical protein
MRQAAQSLKYLEIPMRAKTKTPPQKQLIDFVRSHLNHRDYGATCFGIIRRRGGDDLFAIYWPYLDKINPPIADLWQHAETLVDAEMHAQLTGKEMRHRFCRRADWATYLTQRADDATTAPPPWEGPQRNCHFYPLSAFGLTWDDFTLYRPTPRPAEEITVKPWRQLPIPHRAGQSRKANVLIGFRPLPDEHDGIAAAHPDIPVATAIGAMVRDAIRYTHHQTLMIADLERDTTIVEGGRDRINVSAAIATDDLLRDYANANQVPIGTIIRSIINRHAYWQFDPAP